MKDQQRYQKFAQRNWRRPLAPEEQARWRELAQTQDAQADIELEMALTAGLKTLADTPVSSNFTARVVQEAVRKREADRRRKWSWQRVLEARWQILPRIAFAAFVITAGSIGYHKVNQMERVRIVDSVATVSQLAALPEPEVLSDFDAIHALIPAPGADEELLRLLQ